MLLLGAAVRALEHADRHAQKVIHLLHPQGVAAGQVVVDRDHMDALAPGGVAVLVTRGERVEYHRQGGGESLAFTGLHLGDGPVVQDHPADQLDVEMALLQRALGRLARERKAFEEELVQGFARQRALTQAVVAGSDLLV